MHIYICAYIYIHIYNHSFNNRRSLSLGHNCQAYASGVPLATPLEDVDRLEANMGKGGVVSESKVLHWTLFLHELYASRKKDSYFL